MHAIGVNVITSVTTAIFARTIADVVTFLHILRFAVPLWKRDVAPIEVSIKNAFDNAMAILENTMKIHPMAFGEQIEVFLFDDFRIGMGRTPLGGESALFKIGAISDSTWGGGKVAKMKVLELIAGPWAKLIFPERKVAMDGPLAIAITW